MRHRLVRRHGGALHHHYRHKGGKINWGKLFDFGKKAASLAVEHAPTAIKIAQTIQEERAAKRAAEEAKALAEMAAAASRSSHTPASDYYRDVATRPSTPSVPTTGKRKKGGSLRKHHHYRRKRTHKKHKGGKIRIGGLEIPGFSQLHDFILV